MGSRSRGLAGNLALLAASTAVVVLAVELGLFPAWIHRLPLALHDRIVSPALRTLAQGSKAGPIPHDYVALVGDSYAAGEGDWRLTVDAGGNPPHASAHRLHAATGRDVVSFGHAGAGSLRGLVSEPIGRIDALARTLRFRTPDPAEILIYFYEGNDFEDNLEDLRLRFDPRFTRARLRDAATFRRFLDEVVIGESDLAAEAARPVLLVGGERLHVPMALQGPAPELLDAELSDALWVFEQAALRLRARFRDAGIRVLYIPSPLSTYRLVERPVRVQEDHHRPGRGEVFEPALLRARSDRPCRDVARVAARHGFPLRDARPAFRAAAALTLLHGPRDWRHANREGQELLAREAEALLGTGAGDCATIAPG